jgi:hypothetical protein
MREPPKDPHIVDVALPHHAYAVKELVSLLRVAILYLELMMKKSEIHFSVSSLLVLKQT